MPRDRDPAPPSGPSPTAWRPRAGTPLSVQRAFVVHLGPWCAGRRRFRGRVEHLTSGRTAQFASLAELLEFFGAMVAAESPPPKGEGS